MIAPTRGKKFQPERDAWYARFQEFGTSGFGKRRRKLQSTSINLKYGALSRKYKTIGHKLGGSGLPAREFMKGAFEAKKDTFLSSFKKDLGQITYNYLKRTLPSKYANRSYI
jgi:HK97 gp10 family phage protein